MYFKKNYDESSSSFTESSLALSFVSEIESTLLFGLGETNMSTYP